MCLCFECKYALHSYAHAPRRLSSFVVEATGSGIRDRSQALFLKRSLGTGKLLCFTTPPFPYVGNKDNNLIFMGFLWEFYKKNYTSDWNGAYHMVKCLIKCYLVFNGRPYFSAFHALCPKWWFLNEYTNKPFYKTNCKYLVGMLMS